MPPGDPNDCDPYCKLVLESHLPPTKAKGKGKVKDKSFTRTWHISGTGRDDVKRAVRNPVWNAEFKNHYEKPKCAKLARPCELSTASCCLIHRACLTGPS